jgi:hypothetical protein
VEPGSWKDFKKDAARPFGNRPVAIGYDPARTGDNASVVVMAVPLKPTDKWRLLERFSWRGKSFQYQANRIIELLDRYNVVHIGIDASSEGRGVLPYLEHLHQVTPYTYNLSFKADLVTKALDVIQPPNRLEWELDRENGSDDIAAAFLMVRKTVTEGTGQITYVSARSNANGHADVAWAMMNAMIYEPINASGGRKTRVSFSKLN